MSRAGWLRDIPWKGAKREMHCGMRKWERGLEFEDKSASMWHTLSSLRTWWEDLSHESWPLLWYKEAD